MPLELPIVVPLAAAALSLLAWQHEQLQRWLAIVGAAGLFITGTWLLLDVAEVGMRTRQIGSWPAPYGITIVADHLSALLVAMTGLIGIMVAVYSQASGRLRRRSFIWHPLLNVLLAGTAAAFLAGDIFNLYVWFEVLLMASFVLMALEGERPQLEGAIKYLTINLIASFLLLTAVGLIYGTAGTLNMAHLARRLAGEESGLVSAAFTLFFVAFAIKAAAFPLFFWLPTSYHTPPVAVSALFAGLLTKVGVYALLRIFTLFSAPTEGLRPVLLASAALTMLTGTMGAIVQRDMRRSLSFNLVGHVGYMLLGVGLFTSLGLAGAVFYAVHEMLVITALFLVSGAVFARCGSLEFDRMGGLYRRAPGLAVLFAVPALSLAGVPPLSGFVAKFLLIRASLEAGHYLLAGLVITTTLITLYSMAILWEAAFWKEPSDSTAAKAAASDELPLKPLRYRMLLLPIAALSALTVLAGVYAAPLFSLTASAAEELLDPATYVQSVLGDRP